MQLTLDQLKTRLDLLDSASTECDGQTRLVNYKLLELSIPHTVMCGAVSNAIGEIPLHYWIELEIEKQHHIIDYRCRMWADLLQNPPVNTSKLPHGIFTRKQYPDLVYKGKPVIWQPISPEMFRYLLSPF